MYRTTKKIARPFVRALQGFASRFIHTNQFLEKKLIRKLESEYRSGEIKGIFDIGANRGNWSEAMRGLMPKAEFFLFEANSALFDEIKRKGFHCFIGPLSSPEIRECEFFLPTDTSNTTGGSYYKEVTSTYEDLKGSVLETKTLQEVFEEHSLSQPDLIKIDTQGSELDIMRGGIEIFSKAKWVLIEMPFTEYNQGSPNIYEYIQFLNTIGFVPFQVCESHCSGEVLFQLDVLFLNKRHIEPSSLAELGLAS